MAKTPKKPKADKPGFIEPSYRDTVTPELIERLESGRSLLDVCKDRDMPVVNTVYAWMNADPEYHCAITRARETGYHERAERAVTAAKEATDAGLGRLALDAEKWFLGKVSKAFADKVVISGDPENPVKTVNYDVSKMTDAQLEALAALGVKLD